jgi:hypothetical protein
MRGEKASKNQWEQLVKDKPGSRRVNFYRE